jgi:transcriptional regulator with XRE-family HTH domain
LVPERQRPNNGPAVEITPLQCRAARAGLEWSREHLAELAKVGERTVTDFERHASNMLRSKRTAIRKVFEAAGVTFDAANGIWFAEPTAAPENSEKNSDTAGAENSSETARSDSPA